MKASELIKELAAQIEKHGDLKVIVTGLYSSEDDNLEVIESYEGLNKNNRVIAIASNICSR